MRLILAILNWRSAATLLQSLTVVRCVCDQLAKISILEKAVANLIDFTMVSFSIKVLNLSSLCKTPVYCNEGCHQCIAYFVCMHQLPVAGWCGWTSGCTGL